MEYVYHFRSPTMKGDILFPLNQLKEKYPDLFEQHAKKYVGREVLMEQEIPILKCLWNSVLHISPIHPQNILDFWARSNMTWTNRRFPIFKIPVSNLDDKLTVYFEPGAQKRGDFNLHENQFSKFNCSSYKEQSSVTALQIAAWKTDTAEGNPLFWYSHSTHILYKGQIDVSNVEEVICQ